MAHILGVVRQIFRYPVKSMAGEALAAAELGWHGLAGDRRFAFRRVGDQSGFPWLTAGKLPSLLQYRPSYPEPAAPGSSIQITTPAGQEFSGADPQLCEQIRAAHGSPVELLYLKHGIFDEAPLSLVSTATLAELSASAGMPPDVRRFRPNLLIETTANQPFAEDAWIGSVVAFGNPTSGPCMSIAQQDLRCSMINLDPVTIEADPRMLRAVARTHQACAGIYGAPFRLGTINVGDLIYALPA